MLSTFSTSQDLDEVVEKLYRELGLGPEDIAQRKAYHGLTEADVALIRELHDRLSYADPAFVDRFYDHLRAFAVPRALLPDEAHLAPLREAQSRYFRDLLSGDYDAEYVRERLRVGLIHQRIGLTPRWFLGAYSSYLTGLLDQVRNLLADRPEQALATFRALLKVVFFDMGLALDTYIQADKQSLAESKAFAEQLIDCMPTGLLVLDADLNVQALNNAARQILTLSPETALGQPLARFLPQSQLQPLIEEVQASGRHHHNVELTIARTGGEQTLEISLSPTRFGDQNALLLLLEDVTEAVRLRQEVEDSAARLAALVRNVPDAIITIDEAGIIESFNAAAERIFGYRAQEVIGKNVKLLMPAPYADEHDEYLQRLHATGESVCLGTGKREVEGLRKDGSVFPLDLAASEMRLHDRRLYIGVLRDIGERKQTEAALLRSKAQLRAVFENAVDGIISIDEEARIRIFNPAAEKIFGYRAEEVLGKNINLLMPEPYRSKHDSYLRHYRETGEAKILGVGPREFTGLRKNGETFPMDLAISEMIVGESRYVLGMVRDISQRHQEEQKMRQLSMAMEQVADTVMITDAKGIIEYVNPAFCSITGYTAEEVIGKTPKFLQSGKHDREFYAELWATLKAGRVFRDTFVNRRKDGSEYYEEKTITPLRNAAGSVTHYLSTGKDITEHMQTHARLQYLAHHDLLTGLPNRVLFREHLSQALHSAKRHGSRIGVLFLDLDNFKHLNDTFGHEVGDEALKQLGLRLQAILRSDDTIARLGGDEFVLLLNDLQELEDAGVVAAKILEVLAEPFHLAGQDLYLTASLGISIYPDDGLDVSTLLKQADRAMYQAKAEGRGGFAYYQEGMTEASQTRLLLERDLRTAMHEEQWLLHYQPQLDAQSGKIIGLEALLRWQHPERGLVPPFEFIPLLEETRMILQVGRWVMQEACRQWQAWNEMGIAPDYMAINLSAWQFRDPELVKDLRAILTGCEMHPRHLEIEITESALMANGFSPVTVLNDLKQMGARIAIDDFGTGYSSLGYLKQFPLDQLKIDRSFVKDIPDDKDDCAITRAVIALANSLDLEVVAEGVETEAQRDYLLAQGCPIHQGYLFSPPQPAADIAKMLHANKKRA